MSSPLFRWTIEPSQNLRTDSEETCFGEVNEPNSQNEDGLNTTDSQVSSNELPSQRAVSSKTLAGDDFPNSGDSTPSNIDFDAQTFNSSDSLMYERHNDLESLTNDFDSRCQMRVDASNLDDEIVILSSQPQVLKLPDNYQNKSTNSSTETVSKDEEKRFDQQTAVTNSTPLLHTSRRNSGMLVGLGDSQINSFRTEKETQASSDGTFFEAASQFLEVRQHASQEQKSFSHSLTDPETKRCITAKGSEVAQDDESLRNLEPARISRGSEPCPNADINDSLELMEYLPADPLFNPSDFDYFLDMLNTPPSPNDTYSNPSTISAMVNTLEQLQLSSASGKSAIGSSEQTSSFDETESVKRRKRKLSSPNPVEKKIRRTAKEKTPRSVRPMGKPSKKKLLPSPHHPMVLRTGKTLSEMAPERFIAKVGEPSIQNSIPEQGKKISGKSVQSKGKKISGKSVQSKGKIPSGKKSSDLNPHYFPNQDNEGKKVIRPKGVEVQAPSSNVSLVTQGKRISKKSVKATFEEHVVCQSGKRRGRRKKMPECNSEPLILDSRAAGGETPMRKNLKRGSSQPVGEIYPKNGGRCKSLGVAQIAKGPAEEQVKEQQWYLQRLRRRLLNVLFGEIRISKEEAENILLEVIERQYYILQWSQSDIRDKKIRWLVDDMAVVCENLLKQIGTLIADSSSGESSRTPTPELDYPDLDHPQSQGGNFLVPGTPPSQRRQGISEKSSQTKVKVASNRKNLKKAVGQDCGKKQEESTSQSTNPQRNQMEFSRVLTNNTSLISPRPPPVKILSSQHLCEDTLLEQNISPCGMEIEREEELENFEPTEKPEKIPRRLEACSCTLKLPKICVNRGTNTDFVQAPKHKKIKMRFVDSGTNTDPIELERRKVLVDCSTNTHFYYSVDWNAKDDRKVPDTDNKQNHGPVVDLNNITGVWLPHPDDNVACSYDDALDDIVAGKVPFPQDLIDDLNAGFESD